jgi:hypothetical protein
MTLDTRIDVARRWKETSVRVATGKRGDCGVSANVGCLSVSKVQMHEGSLYACKIVLANLSCGCE